MIRNSSIPDNGKSRCPNALGKLTHCALTSKLLSYILPRIFLSFWKTTNHVSWWLETLRLFWAVGRCSFQWDLGLRSEHLWIPKATINWYERPKPKDFKICVFSTPFCFIFASLGNISKSMSLHPNKIQQLQYQNLCSQYINWNFASGVCKYNLWTHLCFYVWIYLYIYA